MKRVMKEAMGDCSTTGEFRFLVRCQECGRTWHSSPVRFSKAGAEPETEGMRTIFHALYEQEREAAREKAAAEASEIFSRCPVCGKKDFTGIRPFNLMFKTFQGVNENSVSELYLRAPRRRRAYSSTSRM